MNSHRGINHSRMNESHGGVCLKHFLYDFSAVSVLHDDMRDLANDASSLYLL
jgi:hypothetical protein